MSGALRFWLILAAGASAQFATRGIMDGASSSFVGFCVYAFVVCGLASLSPNKTPLPTPHSEPPSVESQVSGISAMGEPK